MPSLRELEQFRDSFRTIGGEASILAERGLRPVELELPQIDGVPADNLPTDTALSGGVLSDGLFDNNVPSEGPSDESMNFDFGAFLDTIPDDLGKGGLGLEPEPGPQFSMDSSENPKAEGGEPVIPPESEDSGMFPQDLLSGFAEEIENERAGASKEEESGAMAPVEDLDLGAPFGGEETGAPLGAEDFSLDDFSLDTLSTESPAGSSEFSEEVPSAVTPEISTESPLETSGATSNELPMDDFDFGGSLEALPEVPIESFPETSADNFSIPAEDLSEAPSEDFSEASAEDFSETPPSPSAEVPLPEDETFSLFAEEAPPVKEEESGSGSPAPTEETDAFDFSIPDFEGGEPTPPAPPLESPIEEASLDSFDTFSLNGAIGETSFGLEDLSSTENRNDFAELEEFSLAGIDTAFGSSAEGTGTPGAAKTKKTGPGVAPEVEEISLSDEELAKLEQTLESYPLNLRIACEELIAEQAVPPDQMSSLIKALVRGASARETAALAGRILGRTIVIPRGFERKTGEELEAEQASLTYIFVHRFLPFVRLFAFIFAVAASAIFLFIRFVYTPLWADGIYRQGYQKIEAKDYSRANEKFTEAFGIYRNKNWFYKYAEKFSEMEQYIFAQQKYEELLRYYPRDKKGALDYAAMETKKLRDYAKADEILRHQILDYAVDDKEALLAQGDNNLEWGSVDPQRYEAARKAFAKLIARYGRQDPYLERMLKYFIRTDNLKETLPLESYFMSSKKTKIAADTLAELGGYLLNKQTQVVDGIPDPDIAQIQGVRDVLMRSITQDPKLPEAYYQLARYYKRFGSPVEERKTLEDAITVFDKAEELSPQRIGFHIDTYRRYGESLISQKEDLQAQQQFQRGIALYEDALKRKLLEKKGEFGRLYADMGDLRFFTAADVQGALAYYRQSIANGWAPPEIKYRTGAVLYNLQDWKGAMESFFSIISDYPQNRRLLFALGNTAYLNQDFQVAKGYYTRLLDLLTLDKNRIPLLLPNDKPEHMDLAERLMRTENNLAVTLEEIADRTGAVALRTQALALYAESARTWDQITRNPVTMVRSPSTNLAYLNTRNSLYPERGYQRQLFIEIDKDVLEPSPWENR